jgi:SAM-dependent methyltransferase
MTQHGGPDTVSRFSDRAADYVKYRPTYPVGVVRAILEGLGPPQRVVAADVGAGTGISARLLGDAGVRVIAVEPGDAMRRAADAHPNVRWIAGRADATGLRYSSVDVVLCAQSFHWFDPTTVLPELARILKPLGRLAIMWNRRSTTDPLTSGYRGAILDVGGETAAERMSFDPSVVPESRRFSDTKRLTFPNFQRLNLDGLIGRARSASYVPKEGPAGERLINLLRALHRQYADTNGYVTLVYETELFLSEKY